MPRYATGAAGSPRTRSAAAANASWAGSQEIPACRAASAGVIPRSAISLAACSRSRLVIRHRGGTAGSHSVNVPRAQASAAHFHRRLTHRRSTGSPARRTSRGRVTTVSCSREDTVPQSGHAAAAGQSVTVHTSTAPPGPAATSATRRPSAPNSADAASWNTMPGTAKCPHSAGQFSAETCSTALPWNCRSSSAWATWPISRQSASTPRWEVSFPSAASRTSRRSPREAGSRSSS